MAEVSVARVVLRIECYGMPRRVGVEARGAPDAIQAVEPFVHWLRRRRIWPGEGRVEITIARPDVIQKAFTEPGAITSYDQLKERAGLTWFFPSEWRGGALHLFDWQVQIRVRLTLELQRRALRAQGEV